MVRNIIPVLLGADLNCYSMARAFHEAYGVKSHVFGKTELGAVKYSRIVSFSKIPPLDEREEVLRVLIDFAKTAPAKPYIFGCTDEYALFLIENRDVLSEHFVCECPKSELIPVLSDKAAFYGECERLGLPYPESVIISSPDDVGAVRDLPFEYPVIIQPSCSFTSWRHPFDGMRKVYVSGSAADGERIIGDIFLSGYDRKIVVQKMIRGEKQFVATAFSSCGDVSAISVGRVLLGELTPKGVGNHVAVITEKNEEITSMVARFLGATKYTGFSNFDIMFDENEGKYYLLEINPRQIQTCGTHVIIAAPLPRIYLE